MAARRASGGGETARGYWLFKSEPSSFSWDDLWAAKGRRTSWEGVRNHQARNLMRDRMRVGDGVLFYHSSSAPPCVVGVAEIVRAAHPDPTQFEPGHDHFDPRAKPEAPTWLTVDVRARRRLPRPVTLAEIKARPALAAMPLVQRGQRLSVQPVSPAEWGEILSLGGLASG